MATQSDTEMRRLGGALDWEDPGLVAALYGLFLGTLSPKGAGQQQPKPGTDQDTRTTDHEGKWGQKTRILPFYLFFYNFQNVVGHP